MNKARAADLAASKSLFHLSKPSETFLDKKNFKECFVSVMRHPFIQNERKCESFALSYSGTVLNTAVRESICETNCKTIGHNEFLSWPNNERTFEKVICKKLLSINWNGNKPIIKGTHPLT